MYYTIEWIDTNQGHHTASARVSTTELEIKLDKKLQCYKISLIILILLCLMIISTISVVVVIFYPKLLFCAKQHEAVSNLSKKQISNDVHIELF